VCQRVEGMQRGLGGRSFVGYGVRKDSARFGGLVNAVDYLKWCFVCVLM
jgi:hypothetical protein